MSLAWWRQSHCESMRTCMHTHLDISGTESNCSQDNELFLDLLSHVTISILSLKMVNSLLISIDFKGENSGSNSILMWWFIYVNIFCLVISLFFSKALYTSTLNFIFLIRISFYVTKSYSLCFTDTLEYWRKSFQNALCSISCHKLSANTWNYPAPNSILTSSIILLPLTTYTQKMKKLWKLNKAQENRQRDS